MSDDGGGFETFAGFAYGLAGSSGNWYSSGYGDITVDSCGLASKDGNGYGSSNGRGYTMLYGMARFDESFDCCGGRK